MTCDHRDRDLLERERVATGLASLLEHLEEEVHDDVNAGERHNTEREKLDCVACSHLPA